MPMISCRMLAPPPPLWLDTAPPCGDPCVSRPRSSVTGGVDEDDLHGATATAPNTGRRASRASGRRPPMPGERPVREREAGDMGRSTSGHASSSSPISSDPPSLWPSKSSTRGDLDGGDNATKTIGAVAEERAPGGPVAEERSCVRRGQGEREMRRDEREWVK